MQKPVQVQEKDIDDDPDILAEKKKSLIWKLRLERYTQLSTAIGVILHNFRAEAISLVSGAGTLVLGWFQIKRWILDGGSENPGSDIVAVVPKDGITTMMTDPNSWILVALIGTFILSAVMAWFKKKKKQLL